VNYQSNRREASSPPNGPPSGLAARAAHWSAEHRKLAIWGWIAFVVVAVVLGNAVGEEGGAGDGPEPEPAVS
jgi:uncharacterized membrane protein YdfJ with MMPL/SSD domain